MDRDPTTRRRMEGAGRLGTALGVLLLTGLGFFFGLVTGAAWEEPRLLAGFVSGRSTDVALDEVLGDGRSDLAGRAASDEPRPLGAKIPVAATNPAAPRFDEPNRPAKKASPPAVAAAPPKPAPKPEHRTAAGDGFSIQVGAFAERRAADALASTLGKTGLPVYVVAGQGAAAWRVRVGPLGSRAEAERISRQLKKDHRLPTWILAESAR